MHPNIDSQQLPNELIDKNKNKNISTEIYIVVRNFSLLVSL
jgi:hypothetical protein